MERELFTVTDSKGMTGTLYPDSELEEISSMALVRLNDTGQEVLLPAGLLISKEEGGYAFPADFEDFIVGAKGERSLGGEETYISLPALQEEVKVGKRRKETARVRISKRVKSREEVVDVPLEEEKVSVRKVPINRFVEGPVPVRHEGDTLIVPLLKEVLVVEKKLMLKEEWHIRKARSKRSERKRVKLRDEEISIKRTNPGESASPKGD